MAKKSFQLFLLEGKYSDQELLTELLEIWLLASAIAFSKSKSKHNHIAVAIFNRKLLKILILITKKLYSSYILKIIAYNLVVMFSGSIPST